MSSTKRNRERRKLLDIRYADQNEAHDITAHLVRLSLAHSFDRNDIERRSEHGNNDLVEDLKSL